MLADFVISQRSGITANAQARTVATEGPKVNDVALSNGIPMFLDQLIVALRQSKANGPIDRATLTESARRHGRDLLRLGLTVRQVVQDYGAVCQAITEMCVQQGAQIEVVEFQVLNLCLDDASAAAVSEFGRLRERAISDQGTERLGILAHELRNLVNVALLAYENLKSGRVAIGGSTGLVLGRSLMGLRDLLDLSLAEVRLDAGIEKLGRIVVSEFLEEVEIGGQLQAAARGVHLTVTSVEREVTIEGDRQVLAAAISNLLQNAFKFSRQGSTVTLTTRATAHRVLFEIEDECGGLPPGKAEELFRPFQQRGSDLSGVGLGLTICLKAAKANGGEMHVRDLPGKGCVFILDLPRKAPPPLSFADGERRARGATGQARIHALRSMRSWPA